jgi:hypothetical protein
MQSYQDEVALRLSRYEVSLELDAGTLEMMVNRARRDVQLATLQMFPERYAAILNLDLVSGNASNEVLEYRNTVPRFGTSVTNTVWKMQLPDDFIQVHAVHVNTVSGEAPAYWEAREVNKTELFGAMRNQNQMPTTFDPIYCIEKDPANSRYEIYVSQGTSQVTPSQVRIWYQKALKYLQLVNASGQPDQETNMSYEYEEMVVLNTMLQALKKTNFLVAKQAIQGDAENLLTEIEANYNSTVDKRGLLLPSRSGLYPGSAVPDRLNNGLAPQQG